MIWTTYHVELALAHGANLSWANLSWANLSWADLSEANLSRADLSEANLSEANLSGANLSWANLSGANLSWADLSEANLSGANLSGANLSGANLSGANLSGANLSGAKHIPGIVAARTLITPAGELRVWKKCVADPQTSRERAVLVELLIPAHAVRHNATGRKCRASEAVVIAIHGAETATSLHDRTFVYRVGETVRPRHGFDPDRWNECGSGIHFYLTKEEAEAHV